MLSFEWFSCILQLYLKVKCEVKLHHTEQLLEKLGHGEELDLSDNKKHPIENIEDYFVESSEDEQMQQ